MHALKTNSKHYDKKFYNGIRNESFGVPAHALNKSKFKFLASFPCLPSLLSDDIVP